MKGDPTFQKVAITKCDIYDDEDDTNTTYYNVQIFRITNTAAAAAGQCQRDTIVRVQDLWVAQMYLDEFQRVFRLDGRD